MTTAIKKAGKVQAVRLLGNRGNGFALRPGSVEHRAFGAHCASVPTRAILSVLVRKNGRRGRSLLVCPRRIVAASRFARGVSFGVNRNHGIDAPALMGALHPQFLTGSRAGGIHARRNLGRGTSYTRTACPPGRKGAQFLEIVQGALAMMRTLTRSVSAAFPSIPEPVFKPVQAAHNRAYSRPKADTFADVADGVEALFGRCIEQAKRLRWREALGTDVRAQRAALAACVADLVAFCKDVEALPSHTAGRC